MRLTDWERERLLIFTAAELAGRHRAAGWLLNAPEASALICEAMLEAARGGAAYEAIEQAGRDAVAASDCLEGVPALVAEVRLEVLMGEGTRLIVLRHPVAVDPGVRTDIEPGQVRLGAGPPPSPPDRARRRLTVRNGSRRTVIVGSHRPFHLVNQRLEFDRAAARGFHLDVPAGDTVRWASGEEREVDLIAFEATP